VTILTIHGRHLKTNIRTHAVCLRAVQKAVATQHDSLGKLSNDNLYTMKFLLHRATQIEKDESLGAVEEIAM
jgi:hypothetical protein